MSTDVLLTLGVAASGMFGSWGVWVSVTIFKLNQEIALLKQQVDLLLEVKDVLTDIREAMGERHGRHL